ncbi:hypothetical protein HID58_030290 [Brassica napus]|uniref:Niemann-Pick C1 N-terminal domain-containing protein n=1 Tax=Brassica napus TaxID=3708 RepID=A0ABQ8CFJ4_BRANA|nr:hypothetical protein HID58_030290 [Brassica napus]
MKEVGENLTVDVKFGTMNTRAINFVGGGAQNFREWFVFIGQKAPPGFPGSPYAINFKSSTPELSAMAPMNLSTYSCGDTSLGCSCGDCPSSPACSSPEPLPPPHEEDSCSFRIGPLKVRCIELSMALLYILLVSSFFGWAVFSRTRDITQPDGSSESLGKRHAHLSPVQRYMATFYKSYGSWIARNPSLVLFISVAIVLALSSGLLHFKVETRPEKLWVGPSSKAAEEKKFFDSHLSPFYRIEQLILATVPDPKTGRAPSLLTWLSLSFFTYTCQEERLSMVQSKNLTLYIFSSESSIEEELKRESTADCFRHSDLVRDRPSTAQFREKLPWFLNALPSADCAKGGHGAYTNSVDLKGYEAGVIHASEFRTYHTPLNTKISRWLCFKEDGPPAWSSAIIVLVLVMILADLMGVMVVLGIQLNAVSVVNLIMSIGIAVEFCVHISHAFLMSNGNREQRARKALETMGASWDHTHKTCRSDGALLRTIGDICGKDTHQIRCLMEFSGLLLEFKWILYGSIQVILSLSGPPQIHDTEEEQASSSVFSTQWFRKVKTYLAFYLSVYVKSSLKANTETHLRKKL